MAVSVFVTVEILKKIPEDMDIEINVSCPNLDKRLVTEGISKFINKKMVNFNIQKLIKWEKVFLMINQLNS